MTEILLREMKNGREVWANYPIRGAHYFTDPRQVINVRRGVICFDEGQMLFAAHEYRKIPPEVGKIWSQSRKNEIDVLYTVQDFHWVCLDLRKITNWVLVFNNLITPDPDPGAIKKRLLNSWLSHIYRQRLFSSTQVEFGRGTLKKPMKTKWDIAGPKVWNAYDTGRNVEVAKYLREGHTIDKRDPRSLPIIGEDLELTEAEYLQPVGPNETGTDPEGKNIETE
jgi:hypothetical protein